MLLFYELLDFTTLSGVVACGVVHWAMHATIIATEVWLGCLSPCGPRPPFRCCSYGGRCPGQRLFAVTDLLLFLILAAASLGSNAAVGLAIFSRLWGRRRMAGSTLRGPDALIRHAEELGDILDVMCIELLQHLLIPHTWQNATTTKALEIRGMVLRIWKNRWMKDRSVSPVVIEWRVGQSRFLAENTRSQSWP
jgi:hypothetical protein